MMQKRKVGKTQIWFYKKMVGQFSSVSHYQIKASFSRRKLQLFFTMSSGTGECELLRFIVEKVVTHKTQLFPP